jgi:hypothetical protein
MSRMSNKLVEIASPHSRELVQLTMRAQARTQPDENAQMNNRPFPF